MVNPQLFLQLENFFAVIESRKKKDFYHRKRKNNIGIEQQQEQISALALPKNCRNHAFLLVCIFQ